MFHTKEERIIRMGMMRCGMTQQKELSEETGIGMQTIRKRFILPETMRLYELRNIARTLNLSPEEVLTVALGEERVKEESA